MRNLSYLLPTDWLDWALIAVVAFCVCQVFVLTGWIIGLANVAALSTLGYSIHKENVRS